MLVISSSSCFSQGRNIRLGLLLKENYKIFLYWRTNGDINQMRRYPVQLFGNIEQNNISVSLYT